MAHPGNDFPAALAAFRDAWARLRAAIRATPDLQQRFDRATETRERLAKMESEAVTERADAAASIQDAESLTLAALGQRISMTKQAAGRLTGRIRKPKGQ